MLKKATMKQSDVKETDSIGNTGFIAAWQNPFIWCCQ